MYLSLLFSIIFAAIVGGYAWLYVDADEKANNAEDTARYEEMREVAASALAAYSSVYFPFHALNYLSYASNSIDKRFDGKAFISGEKYCDLIVSDEKFILENCDSDLDALDPGVSSELWSAARKPFTLRSLDGNSNLYKYFIAVASVKSLDEWNGARIPYAEMYAGVAARIGKNRYESIRFVKIPTVKVVKKKIESVRKQIERFAKTDLERARVAYETRSGNPFVFDWALTRMECEDEGGATERRYFYQKGASDYAPATFGLIGIPNDAFLDPSYIPTEYDDPPIIETGKVYDGLFKDFPDSLYAETNATVLSSAGVYGKILYKMVADFIPSDAERTAWTRSVSSSPSVNSATDAIYGEIWRLSIYGGDEDAGYGYFCEGGTRCVIKRETVSGTSATGDALGDVKLEWITLDDYWREFAGRDSSSMYNPLLDGIEQRGILLYDNSSIGVYGKRKCEEMFLKGDYAELYAVPYPVDAFGSDGNYEDPLRTGYKYPGLLIYKFGIAAVE